MQKKKNIRLLIILALMIAVTVIVMTMDNHSRRTSFDDQMFAVEDTSKIEKIIIAGPGYSNELIKEENRWTVNGKFPLDEGLRRILLPVLKEIRVRRPVAENIRQSVVEMLNEKGTRVDIYGGNKLLTSFLSGGEQEDNLTYFLQPGKEQPYVVHLPGYESYVAGLFEITENDWRERIVMTVNWQSLDELKMTYPGEQEKSFSIQASQRGFFTVPGLESIDSAAIQDYLQQSQYILADKYIAPGEMPVYDSLSRTQPFAILALEEIGKGLTHELSFFPLQKNDHYLLGRTASGQLALFEYERIKGLFAKQEDFY